MSAPLSIPHFQQSADGYCLSACARMVLAYLGIKRSEAQVRKALGAEAWGTPTFAIQRLASAKLEIIYREWSIAELLSTLTAGQPVIVFVRTGFLGYYSEDFAHALVVVGASPEQQFWVHDPGQPSGPIIVAWDGLLAAWAEFGYRGAALLKK